jgi:AcrR family transcriptional regulator
MQQASQHRRTQGERRAATEHRVLEAAMDLAAAGGVRAVTLAAVGREAGYSRGIVSHHFGSRRALMDALARAVQGRFSPGPLTGSGLDRVLGLVDAYLGALRANARDAHVFLVLWTAAIASDEDLRPVFAERDGAFRSSMASAVRAGVADGSIRGDADPEASAVALVALMRGTSLQRLLTPDAIDLPAVREEIARMLRAGLVSRAGDAAARSRTAAARTAGPAAGSA